MKPSNPFAISKNLIFQSYCMSRGIENDKKWKQSLKDK